MKILTVVYSEDFRKNRVAGQIYSILRNNGLNLFFVAVIHNPKTGIGEAMYHFEDTEVPDKSELVEILKGIKLNEVNLK